MEGALRRWRKYMRLISLSEALKFFLNLAIDIAHEWAEITEDHELAQLLTKTREEALNRVKEELKRWP